MEIAPRLLGNGRLSYRPPFIPAGSSRWNGSSWARYWMDPENTRKYDGHDLFNVFATCR